MLVLHWFVGNDEDNVMGVVSHDHLCTDVPSPSEKIGRRDVCESLIIIVFLFPRNVGDSL